MLEVCDLAFDYTTPVLKGVSFTVHAGELVAIIGPNGSGKSTLLKNLLRILEPTNGRIRFEEREVQSLSRRELAARFGYVPQDASLRFPLTSLEYVLQGRFAQGRIFGFESEQDLIEAQRAMALTQATSFASRIVTRLSGGERQRVMLARALVSNPRMLLLDEPVANLDVAHQVGLFEMVRTLTATGKLSAIVVTHELNLAAEYADKVLLLKAGEVVAFGSPDEVMTEKLLSSLFETDLLVDRNPVSGAPRITLVAPHHIKRSS